MIIKEEYPPNYQKIVASLDLRGRSPIFAYGNVIYNPHKSKLRPDIIAHEEVHERQMGDNPEAWWDKYLGDGEFRLSQELEAYQVQYGFLEPSLSCKGKDEVLDALAGILSSPLYGSILTFGEAKSKIRNA